jgi:hypothetical protein
MHVGYDKTEVGRLFGGLLLFGCNLPAFWLQIPVVVRPDKSMIDARNLKLLYFVALISFYCLTT